MRRLQPYIKEYAGRLAKDCREHSSRDFTEGKRYRFRIFTNSGTRFEYDQYKWAFEHEFLTNGAAERLEEEYTLGFK